MLLVLFCISFGINGEGICGIGEGWVYSFKDSWILNASFRRLCGRKGNFSINECMFVDSDVWRFRCLVDKVI